LDRSLVINLVSSRSQRTLLAATIHLNQSIALKGIVEKAFCKNGK